MGVRTGTKCPSPITHETTELNQAQVIVDKEGTSILLFTKDPETFSQPKSNPFHLGGGVGLCRTPLRGYHGSVPHGRDTLEMSPFRAPATNRVTLGTEKFHLG